METVHWGIIGCGNVCEVKSGPAFYKTEHSQLDAVMRRDENKIADFARRHNVPRYYTDGDELLKDEKINAVYIATPPGSHKEYTIKALKSGRPVYVEKPMALNHAECLEMIEAAEKSGQKLFVAYYRRALPYFLKVKELLDQHVIGNTLMVEVKLYRSPSQSDLEKRANWRLEKSKAGGGYFYDLAPHTLDILDFLLGEITEAKGVVENLGSLYEVEDTVSAVFKFKTGICGIGQWCFVTSKENEEDTIEITGTQGKLLFNTFQFNPIALTTSTGKEYFRPPQPEHIQQPLIQTIVNELRGTGICPSTGVSAARIAKVMDWITSPNLSEHGA